MRRSIIVFTAIALFFCCSSALAEGKSRASGTSAAQRQQVLSKAAAATEPAATPAAPATPGSFATPAPSDTSALTVTPDPTATPNPTPRADPLSGVSVAYYIAVDANNTDTVFYEKNADRRVAPASTTKILTCILALEHCTLDETVTTPAAATKLGATQTRMGLSSGEELPLLEMLYGLMLPSGNDAAIALAYHIAGDPAAFAVMMNEKAAELGMTNSHFVTASGTYKGAHYVSARDMAVLTAYALKNQTFREIVATPKHTVPASNVRQNPIELVNSNKMLVGVGEMPKIEYDACIGVKTGSTPQRGTCLVSAADDSGLTVIVVQLCLDKPESRSKRREILFEDARLLFDTIYASDSVLVTANDLGLDADASVQVDNPRMTDPDDGLLALTADLSAKSFRLTNADRAAIEAAPDCVVQDIQISESVAAPVSEGDVLGTVSFRLGDRTLVSADLTASRSVEAYDPADEPTPVPATPSPVPTAEPAVPADCIPLALTGGILLVIVLLLFIMIFRNERASKRS